MVDWFKAHEGVIAGATVVSIGSIALLAIVLPFLLARLPADYFVADPAKRSDRHPAVHALLVIAKNLVGWPVLIAGVAMLVLPGQGLLTMLVGLMLIDLPGKRRLELAILRRPQVRKAIDWLRERAHRPPLQIPD